MECPICFIDRHDFHQCQECGYQICKTCKRNWDPECPYCKATRVRSNENQELPLLNNYRPSVQEKKPRPRICIFLVSLGFTVSTIFFIANYI